MGKTKRKYNSISSVQDKMTQSTWLEYLNNYIERHLIKQQSSGFSNWALAGVLILILYRIFDFLPEFNEKKYFCAVFFINILNLYSVYLCVSVYFTDSNIKYIDSPYWQRSARLYVCLYIIVVGLGIVSSYWLSEYVREEGYPNYGYFLLTITYTLYFIDTLYRFFFYERYKKVLKDDSPNIAFFSMTRPNFRMLDGIGGILFFLATICSLSGVTWNAIVNNIRILQLTLEFCAFFYITNYLFERLPLDKKIEELQILEYKIVLYNLDADTIRKEFQSIHFEKTITNWVDERRLGQNSMIQVIGYDEKMMNESIEQCKDVEYVENKYNFLCLSMANFEKQLKQDDKGAQILLSQLGTGEERRILERFRNENYDKGNKLLNMKQTYHEIMNNYQHNADKAAAATSSNDL